MKGIVRLSVILSLCLPLAKADAGSKDEQSKQTFNGNANAIGSHHKPDLLSYQQITQYGDKQQPEQIVYHQRYQPRSQHLQQATPYQHQQEPLIRKPNLFPQHQPMPVAMVIIAQPAYIPASMLQNGNVAQQILNYFHGNSQPRYQYIPIRNPQHQYVPVPVQSQQISQYVHYQPQQDIAQTQPTAPEAQAQSTQFYPHEALPTPQALTSSQHIPQHETLPTPQSLISTQHVVSHHEALPSPQALISSQHVQHHHFSQQNIVDGRALQYNVPQQQTQYHYGQPHRPVQQLVDPQQNEEQQLQQEENQQPQKPLQSTDISQLAQQAAQHFLMNGGLKSGSRTAPAIITGLEHFSPEQQEKIKAQLGVHFGSPLKPLNLGGEHEQTEQESNISPPSKYYQDQKQRQKTQRFVPSIEVKDGEIRQSTSGSGKM